MTDVPPKIGRSSSEKRIKKGDGTSLDGMHEGAPGIIHVSRRSSKVYSASELPSNRYEGAPGNISRRSSKLYSVNELQTNRLEGLPGNMSRRNSKLYSANELQTNHLEGPPGNMSRRNSKLYSANELQTNHLEGPPGNMSRRSSKLYSANELQSDRNEEVVYSNHMNIICINFKLDQLMTDNSQSDSSSMQGFNAFEDDIMQHSLPFRKNNKGRSMASIVQSPSYGMLNMSANLSNSMAMLSNTILLGGRSDAEDLDSLKRLGVTHILNVAVQCSNCFPQSFVYMKIPMLDSLQGVDITKYKDYVVKYLSHVESINGRVLVHCVVGVSRSVSILLMYWIVQHRIPLKIAFTYVKSCRMTIYMLWGQRLHVFRRQICPNESFKLQLAMLEVHELGFSSVAKDSDPTWDFYDWNRIRHSMPTRNKYGESLASYRKSSEGGCCSVS